MKYYIQKHSWDVPIGIWRVVKRLRDFKAEDGVEYIIKTHGKPIRNLDSYPVYIGKGDKLKKTDYCAVFTGWE